MSAGVVSWSQRWAGRSITFRLLLAVLLMVLLALPIAGWLLAHHYRTAAVGAFDERLEATLNVVIAGVTYDPLSEQLSYERALGDPRFDHVYSGWYWQITDEANHTVTSRSLWDQRLPVLESERLTARTLLGPRGQQLRVVERDIYLGALEAPLHVSVAARDDDLREDIKAFQQVLWLGLLGLGVMLLGVLALQVRWGLAPLRRMNANLRDVEQGRAEQLDTRLPEELATLAASMNAVLARDQRLIERGRHTAGNLAHALKTPISVMRLLAKQLPSESRSAWEAELSRIDSAVRHHLARASAAGEGVRFAYTVSGEGGLSLSDEGFTLAADQVFTAIGQTLTEGIAGGLKLSGGKIEIDDSGRTSLEGVWAGGDCVAAGEDLTVTAVAQGRDAAESIHAALTA